MKIGCIIPVIRMLTFDIDFAVLKNSEKYNITNSVYLHLGFISYSIPSCLPSTEHGKEGCGNSVHFHSQYIHLSALILSLNYFFVCIIQEYASRTCFENATICVSKHYLRVCTLKMLLCLFLSII